MEAIREMRTRIFKSLEKGIMWTIRSLKNPTYQIVLGVVIIIYTAFLEQDRESVLSLLMGNPIGRLLILGLLALLAVASPPVAIVFAVLIVMSTVGKSTEAFHSCGCQGCGLQNCICRQQTLNHLGSIDYDDEGFEDTTEKKTDKKTEDKTEKITGNSPKKDDTKETEQKASALQNIADRLHKLIPTSLPGLSRSDDKKEKEGFYNGEDLDDEFDSVNHELVSGFSKEPSFHSV